MDMRPPALSGFSRDSCERTTSAWWSNSKASRTARLSHGTRPLQRKGRRSSGTFLWRIRCCTSGFLMWRLHRERRVPSLPRPHLSCTTTGPGEGNSWQSPQVYAERSWWIDDRAANGSRGFLRMMDERSDPTHLSPVFMDLLRSRILPRAGLKLADHLVYPPRGFRASPRPWSWLFRLGAALVPGNAAHGDVHVFVLRPSQSAKSQ
jgi:hypothetical protein